MSNITKAMDDWDNLWKSYSQGASINPAQEFRRREIVDLVKAHGQKNGRILDVGCGCGELLELFQREFPTSELCGVDGSLEALKQTQRRLPADLKTAQINLESEENELATLEGWADIVTFSEVLEHLDKPEIAIKNIKRLLSPNGVLFLTVPGGPRSAFDRYIGHRQHFTVEKIRELLIGQGFNVRLVRGSGFPFFNLYKLIIVLMGSHFVKGAATKKVATANEPPSLTYRIAAVIFDILFRFNWNRGKHGWQLIAVADLTKPNASV